MLFRSEYDHIEGIVFTDRISPLRRNLLKGKLMNQMCIRDRFNSMQALSTRNDDPQHASRPFDKDRDGFVIGEGAGALIFEEYGHAKARGAKIYCEIKMCIRDRFGINPNISSTIL